MMVHFKKKQKDIMYDTPVIFFDKPDKSVLSEVEQMIEDTEYQGNYWDRVYLYQKFEKMGIPGIPMCIEVCTSDGKDHRS